MRDFGEVSESEGEVKEGRSEKEEIVVRGEDTLVGNANTKSM